MLLKERRIDAGLSQRELAVEAGVSQTLISGAERGKIQITLQKASRIATALNCTVDDLLRDERDPKAATG